MLAGFPDQVAVRLDEGTLRCALVHGRRGVLARESVVHRARLLVASEIREIEDSAQGAAGAAHAGDADRGGVVARTVSGGVSRKRGGDFDAAARRVVGAAANFLPRSRPAPRNGATRRQTKRPRLLAKQVIAGTCPLKHWDNAVEQWILRVNWIAASAPELELPPIREDDQLLLIEQVCSGAVSYKEIKDRAVWPAVKSWLSSAQQGLVDQYAPERIALPNGRKAKVIYSASTPPAVAVRIQDLYGVERNLTIGPARAPLVIQVLAPNHRPDPDHERSGGFLARRLPEDQEGVAAEVSETRVALTLCVGKRLSPRPRHKSRYPVVFQSKSFL